MLEGHMKITCLRCQAEMKWGTFHRIPMKGSRLLDRKITIYYCMGCPTLIEIESHGSIPKLISSNPPPKKRRKK